MSKKHKIVVAVSGASGAISSTSVAKRMAKAAGRLGPAVPSAGASTNGSISVELN